MNTNRKRDVEELLRSGSVPQPPADLLDRIKNEIPAELPRSGVAPRPSGRVRTYWLPIAASLLLAVGLGVMMLVVNPKSERESPVAATAERATPAAPPQKMAESRVAEVAPPPPPPKPAPPQQKLESGQATSDAHSNEVREQQPVAIAEAEKPKVDEFRTATGEQPYIMRPAPASAPARPEETSIAMQDRAAEGVVAGASADQARTETDAVAQAAPAPPAPMVAAAPPVAQAGRGQTESRKLASEPQRERDNSVIFSFLRGGPSYDAARDSLRADRLPSRSTINPFDFLANFTYGDVRPARAPFALSTELVSLETNRSATRALLRVAVTARGARATDGGSNAVLAHDLRCKVTFDDAVTPKQLVAASADDHGARNPGEVLPGYNASAVFEVSFASRAPARVATVTLTWADPDGSPQRRTVDVVAAETASWDRASAGFKLAQVAVSLAETLKGTPIETESMLLRHAGLLPIWFPRDAAVSELVTLVRKATSLLNSD